ncbi:MAG TPA: ribonuclease J [Alphaproteobacteria bacterium]|nr:ribonuclease J [Alphaproteobacteria bacterium]
MPLDNAFQPLDDAVDIIPLGGAGGFGMNLTLYGHAGKWLMVDLGMGFAGENVPGVDLIVPDPTFIAERRKDLVGLVLTHAHEDHLGAVPFLWPRLRCPVYATPFTATVLRMKLIEHGLQNEVEINIIPQSGSFSLGPFDLRYVDVTHSIPEPNLLTITTSAGTVVHTGDWKIDPHPVIGKLTDIDQLKRVGDAGVLAMIGDSTNATTPGRSASEGDLQTSLRELFGRYDQRIVVACFSSNVARIESIAAAAAANNRHCAIVGRSLWRIVEAARETGYLKGLEFLTASEAEFLPRSQVVVICTGSQGEPRSALARIAANNHPELSLDKGDTVIFSARPIPGNEVEIAHMQGRLLKQGVQIVTAKQEFVHVSGHPAQDEMVDMFQWIRPQTAVAVHGEFLHQSAHAQIARDCQVPHTIVAGNGEVIRVRAGQGPEVVGETQTGVFAVDGKRLIAINGSVIKGRRRQIEQGSAVVTIVLDHKGRVMAPPQVTATGLLSSDQDQAALEKVVDDVALELDEMTGAELRSDVEVRESVRLAARRSLFKLTGKKPAIDVHLVRVS